MTQRSKALPNRGKLSAVRRWVNDFHIGGVFSGSNDKKQTWDGSLGAIC
jgi:hypothetical protein